MRFRILGPVQVWDGVKWQRVRADQQRLVLAVLLTEAGQVVSTERLVQEVWGDRPPRTAVPTMHSYVMRLRRLVGDGSAGLLVTRGRGYELAIRDGDLDAWEFERLVGEGRKALADGLAAAAEAKLEQALALWHGQALADVPGLSGALRVAQLERTRLAAVEDRLAARLDLNRYTEIVDELYRLVEEHPLRERLWELLMRAQYRCGRRADALETFQRARRVLLEELGLEPGTPLQHLQREILTEPGAAAAASPANPPMVPAQLPPDVGGFVGRGAYLERLAALLPRTGDLAETAVVISAIAGTAGVGKTALVIHWAHQVRDWFSDGQLYVNLHAYSADAPVPPAEALARFLRALGVPPEQVPADLDEASALYRSLLAGKRVLVVVDNARRPDQVRPLLPGGPGSLALVTSRDRLGGLVAREGATTLTLDVLAPDEAQRLLAHMLGADRVAVEPEAAAELARLCGNLPLALRIAAANLATRPRTTLAEYTARLRRDRLDSLQLDGDPREGVRATINLSYQALAEDARRLFRLLGLAPGADVTIPAAAALAGIDATSAARRLLDQLEAAHLVTEQAPGRYLLHDLLRVYGAERAEAEEADTERQAALDRLFAHYQRHVDAAAELLYPEVLRAAPGTPSQTRFPAASAAAAWLDAEQANLVASIQHAAQHGQRQVAWRLTDSLRGDFVRRMSTIEWRAAADASLAAATEDDDPLGLTASHLGLATLHSVLDQHEEASGHYQRAIAHAQRAGWPEAEAAAVGNLGVGYITQGQLRAALKQFSRSLEMHQQLGRLPGVAVALENLGQVYWCLGRLEPAAEHYAQAVALFRKLGASASESRAHAFLGQAYHDLGRMEAALSHLASARTALQEVANLYYLGHVTYRLADVHRDLGRYAEALALAESAVAVSREASDASLESEALVSVSRIHHHLGDYQRAVAGLERATELIRTVGDRRGEAVATIHLADAYRGVGRDGLAADLATKALDHARRGGYRLLEGQAGIVLAAVQLGHGDPVRARQLAQRAARVHVETGHRLGQARANLVAERALRGLGRHADADLHGDAARRLFAEIGMDPSRHAAALGLADA